MTGEVVGLLGGGVIGGGWAARFLLHGLDVRLYDPDPDAPRKVAAVLAHARRSLPRLVPSLPAEGSLTFVATPEEAADGAGFVQESAPERLEVKRALLARAARATEPGVVLASSTSGLLPSALQEGLAHPDRLVVGHPFNPVYLLPLVEVVGGRATNAGVLDRAAAMYRAVGMAPLVLATEVDGFVADRLLEALWREALWLVNDGVATVSQIDDAICLGAGLRWSAMGTFLVYRLGGGEAGMRHFMAQFGPALQWPWTKLTDVPELTDELIDRIVAQSDEQAEGRSITELEALRDDCLVAVIKGLGGIDFGAGAVVNAHEARRRTGPGVTGGPGGPATAVDHPRHVAVTWAGGPRRELPHRWLRDNCPCPACRHPRTGERLVDTFAFDPHLAPAAVRVEGVALGVDWSDGHRSEWPLGWLLDHGPGARAASPPPTVVPWGAEFGASLPECDYAAVVGDGDGGGSGGERARFVDAVATTGLVVVRGAPTTGDATALRQLARCLGTVRATIFGPEFHVEYVADPNNVAYTAVELRPHTDLPYYRDPPGVQLLHCLAADAPGGDSTFADGFWVADRVRAADPDALRVLGEVAVPYRFHDADHDLRWAAPVVEVGGDGSWRGIRFHHALMAPFDMSPPLIEATYAALGCFDAVARSAAAQVVLRLGPGDVVAFDNRRVLHGRTAFDPTRGRRHLVGLYVDAVGGGSRLRV